MRELGSELELLDLEVIGEQYDALRKQGVIADLSEQTQDIVIDTALTVLGFPIREVQECGCVTMHGPFSSVIPVEQRANTAVKRYASGYDYLRHVGDPDRYLAFVQSSEYIPAMVAIGCLTATLEERGRILRENREATMPGKLQVSHTTEHDTDKRVA